MFGGGEGNSVARGDRLQRVRRRGMLFLMLLFWSFQLVFPQGGDNPGLPLGGPLKLPAFLVWAAALLVMLCVSGGRLLAGGHRAAMNDELTRNHRFTGFVAGFWVALLTATGMYFVTMFEPVTAREALRIVVTLGVSTSIAAFVFLEERADRGR